MGGEVANATGEIIPVAAAEEAAAQRRPGAQLVGKGGVAVRRAAGFDRDIVPLQAGVVAPILNAIAIHAALGPNGAIGQRDADIVFEHQAVIATGAVGSADISLADA